MTKYTHRLLARFVIEAKTPLSVGSGVSDIISDSLVATDVNGLPYIPGTSIAGVVRHMFACVYNSRNEYGQTLSDIIWGYQEDNDQADVRERTQKEKEEAVSDLSKGSDIIFTDAKILNSQGVVIDGIVASAKSDSLLKHYQVMPIRQHAKIGSNGATVKTGKFDEQVCFAGSRFCFELEMVSNADNIKAFNDVLELINSKTFRIGSGTRCGFGEIEVVDMQSRILDLENNSKDLNDYINKSSSLCYSDFWKKDYKKPAATKSMSWTNHSVEIKPQDFFLFGSGFPDIDGEADVIPVTGSKVVWSNGIGELRNNLLLIPATSVKGAIAHRVAYHWNRINGYFIGNDLAKTGNRNKAVQILFGYEMKDESTREITRVQKRGNVIISDIIREDLSIDANILNKQTHVSIDRFTGGAKAKTGALFTEKNVYGDGMSFTIEIFTDDNQIMKECEAEGVDFKMVKKSLEDAINDLKRGMLPLGGGSGRGHGVFVEC